MKKNNFFNKKDKPVEEKPLNEASELLADEKKPEIWWQPAVIMFAKMSGWVVTPVIVAIFLGRFLDAKYDIEPWGSLLAVFVAFLISVYGIVKNAKQEYRRMDEEDKGGKK